MALSTKVTVITMESATIEKVFPCWGPNPPSPPRAPRKANAPVQPKDIQLYSFTRPDEGSGPLDDDAIKTGYEVQGGALVKKP